MIMDQNWFVLKLENLHQTRSRPDINSFVTNWEFKIFTQLEVNGSDMVLAIVAKNFETVT